METINHSHDLDSDSHLKWPLENPLHTPFHPSQSSPAEWAGSWLRVEEWEMTDPSASVTYYPFSSLLQSPVTGQCAAAGAWCVQVEMSAQPAAAQWPVYNTTPLTTVGCTNVQLRIPASLCLILIDNAQIRINAQLHKLCGEYSLLHLTVRQT